MDIDLPVHSGHITTKAMIVWAISIDETTIQTKPGSLARADPKRGFNNFEYK